MFEEHGAVWDQSLHLPRFVAMSSKREPDVGIVPALAKFTCPARQEGRRSCTDPRCDVQNHCFIGHGFDIMPDTAVPEGYQRLDTRFRVSKAKPK